MTKTVRVKCSYSRAEVKTWFRPPTSSFLHVAQTRKPVEVSFSSQVFSNTQFNSYGEAKKAAEQYQTAKQQMKRAFEAAGCGKWMYKPAEEEDF